MNLDRKEILGGRLSTGKRITSLMRRCKDGHSNWFEFDEPTFSGTANAIANGSKCETCGRSLSDGNIELKRGWHLEPMMPNFEPRSAGRQANAWYNKVNNIR